MVFYLHGVTPVNKMAKWLGLSLSPWKLFNIVMTTSNRGGKKNKTGEGGGGGCGEGCLSRPTARIQTDPLNEAPSLLLSPRPRLVCFRESRQKPSSRTLRR